MRGVDGPGCYEGDYGARGVGGGGLHGGEEEEGEEGGGKVVYLDCCVGVSIVSKRNGLERANSSPSPRASWSSSG